MNNLMIFENKEVEVFEFNGQVLFNPKDVAECLEISDVNSVTRTFNEKQIMKLKNSNMHGMHFRKLHNTGENFLTESGVYKLIFKSRKAAAERFQDWVTDEVLPQIRETGGYIPHDEDDSEEDIIAKAFLIAKKKIDKLNKKIDEDSHKVLFANAVTHSEDSILIRQLAKLISQNGINIGEKRLFAWLRDNGYLIKSGKDKNEPTQKSMNMKLFDVSEAVIIRNGKEILSRTSYVTGKGQTYFINKFLKLYSKAV